MNEKNSLRALVSGPSPDSQGDWVPYTFILPHFCTRHIQAVIVAKPMWRDTAKAATATSSFSHRSFLP